jgi:hypothetical protein
MGSWHTAVSPCHCDNPLYCGLMFLKKKKKILNHVLPSGSSQVPISAIERMKPMIERNCVRVHLHSSTRS